MVGTTKILAALCCLLLMTGGPTAFAGPLETATLAYNDGNGPDSGAWRGTAPYSNGSLVGTIDYAVFTAANFILEYPGATYVPTPGELVYAYQVRNGPGSPAVTFEGVSADPADNIGSFLLEVGNIAPTVEAFGAGTAEWFFFTPPVDMNQNSFGLVFSSLNRPELTGTSVTIDGGITAIAIVPTPGDVPIPEPATLVLLSISGLFLTMLRGRLR